MARRGLVKHFPIPEVRRVRCLVLFASGPQLNEAGAIDMQVFSRNLGWGNRINLNKFPQKQTLPLL